MTCYGSRGAARLVTIMTVPQEDNTMSVPANPIRVGLIGYGYSGKTFHAPLINAVTGLALSAVASSDPASMWWSTNHSHSILRRRAALLS